MNHTSALNVQFGAGTSAPVGWLNFDASPTLKIQRLPIIGSLLSRGRVVFPDNVLYGDVTVKLPVEDGSCNLVYCSHVLEHLALQDFRRALREAYRILAPGGTFRGVLPDLELLVNDYIQSSQLDASISFMESTMLGLKERPKTARSRLEAMLGNTMHLWMWDYNGLSAELESAGFVSIRRAQFGDNPNPDFQCIELADRWLGCLGFECKRPD